MSLSDSDTEYFHGEDGELYVCVLSVKPAKRPKKLQFDEEALELNVSMKSSDGDMMADVDIPNPEGNADDADVQPDAEQQLM